ncbi:hypothetical protein PENTCL1PPCAC_25652 [Pristionchus entomophagus]|uniref:Ubiquitin carboxyl-terminal hydrolase n=1 Tax=Pristionchus entomophagus TaxID=358040 RepID=A0AAV5UAL8_9BILA|nr:hypothetical protein PENTCL1PPCAC_25652 [Pristionchus entomophagus]
MSVDCLKNFSLDDVRRARIDFTSGGTIPVGDYVPDFLGKRCTVLQADKIRFGDKSTTGSPISSHRGSSVHHDSSGSSSSGSPIASPISYTRDLIGVDSPGLSGGAGSMTPVKKEQMFPMVPRQVVVPKSSVLQPRSVMLTAEPSPQPPPVPPRKSRFDVKPEDMEVDKKPKVEPSLLPNGKRKAQSESEEESKSDEETVDPRRMGSLGLFVKRIKLETLSTETIKPPYLKSSLPPLASPSSLVASSQVKPTLPPLVPRAVAAAVVAASTCRVGPPTPPPKRVKEEIATTREKEEETSDEEDQDEIELPIIGPQPLKTNGAAKSPVKSASLSRENSATSLVSAATTGAAGSVVKSSRKRLLSERGEKELSYPVMEKEISSKWGWDGAQWLNTRKRGQGLINRANDCFLNVILQMITHTAPLARYLVERHKSDCKREQHACVGCAIRDNHLGRTFRLNGAMETRWIGSHLKRIFPSHSFGMQEDAHELLSLLLDAIDPPPGWNRDNTNKELPTNKLKPSTPIEQIFGGTLRNQVTCQSCHTPFINYERIRELNVALGRKQEERIPLSNLVQDYFKNETIATFSCKKCSRKTQAVRQTRVLRAPAVLIVQLKRFNAYGGKIRQPIAAEKELDLTKFTYDAQEGEGGGKRAVYALTGVVEHLGSTVDHGHYVAYCKSTDNLNWFKFDDEDVSRQNGYSNNPYLLFYSRKDLQPKIKNGQVNGVTSTMPSTSKLVVPNGNAMMKPVAGNNNGSMPGQQNGHTNGVMRPTVQPVGGGGYGHNNGGGPYAKTPYQNGGMQPKAYTSNNGNGYGNGNKFNNGYGKQYNQYNNKFGARPIKTFNNNQQYKWKSRQQI